MNIIIVMLNAATTMIATMRNALSMMTWRTISSSAAGGVGLAKLPCVGVVESVVSGLDFLELTSRK